MKKFYLIFALFLITIMASGVHAQKVSLQDYNVKWTTPSINANGSMPLGNGDIGLNVWVENNGDICFYIGKIDTWDENGRLLKVGKVRVKCEPAIYVEGNRFEQELDLKTGTVIITSQGKLAGKKVNFTIRAWVDANYPVIRIYNQSSVPVSMKASIELWRKERQALPSIECSDLFEDRSKPDRMYQPIFVEPDSILKGSDKFIGWCHHNSKSVGFDFTNQLQGLSEFIQKDPLKDRTFGAIITGTKASYLNDTLIQTQAAKSSHLNIYVLAEHPSNINKWLSAITGLANQDLTVGFKERKTKHEQWWAGFWDRSYIHASTTSGDTASDKKNNAFDVSRAYALQRFVTASAGRGKYPIKFNGSIFTVPFGGRPGNADYRQWGPGYWWQNTRLPYISMCASGDFDMMQPLFNMYAGQIYTLSKFRTQKYFGFDGAYFTECTYPWGAVFTADYGYLPFEKRTDKLQESGWHKWEWVSGLELVFMMLDYYDYTGDHQFLNDTIVPVANDVLRFFNNYYACNDQGKLVMHPSQSLETWWNCTNPMPELAGLYSITNRLSALPENRTKKEDREFWKMIASKLPDIPVRETPSGKALAPATRFEEKLNVENPELYGVFPFRLYGIGRLDIDLAKNALEHRWDKGAAGWRQDDVFMAYLGLTDQAKDILIQRVNQKSEQNLSRFPAFWGPNYDWIPDQDHGSVIMKTVQSMLLQTDPYTEKIYLLPAWPKEWDVSFKLHAPKNTIIEGELIKGKISKLKVTPESRRKDISIAKEFVLLSN